MIRLSCYARYRSGAEVLIRDSGPVFELSDAQRIVTEIRTLIAEHGAALLNGETELIVRCAVRQFEAEGDRPRKAPPMPRRQRAAGEF